MSSSITSFITSYITSSKIASNSKIDTLLKYYIIKYSTYKEIDYSSILEYLSKLRVISFLKELRKTNSSRYTLLYSKFST